MESMNFINFLSNPADIGVEKINNLEINQKNNENFENSEFFAVFKNVAQKTIETNYNSDEKKEILNQFLQEFNVNLEEIKGNNVENDVKKVLAQLFKNNLNNLNEANIENVNILKENIGMKLEENVDMSKLVKKAEIPKNIETDNSEVSDIKDLKSILKKILIQMDLKKNNEKLISKIENVLEKIDNNLKLDVNTKDIQNNLEKITEKIEKIFSKQENQGLEIENIQNILAMQSLKGISVIEKYITEKQIKQENNNETKTENIEVGVINNKTNQDTKIEIKNVDVKEIEPKEIEPKEIETKEIETKIKNVLNNQESEIEFNKINILEKEEKIEINKTNEKLMKTEIKPEIDIMKNKLEDFKIKLENFDENITKEIVDKYNILNENISKIEKKAEIKKETQNEQTVLKKGENEDINYIKDNLEKIGTEIETIKIEKNEMQLENKQTNNLEKKIENQDNNFQTIVKKEIILENNKKISNLKIEEENKNFEKEKLNQTESKVYVKGKFQEKPEIKEVIEKISIEIEKDNNKILKKEINKILKNEKSIIRNKGDKIDENINMEDKTMFNDDEIDLNELPKIENIEYEAEKNIINESKYNKILEKPNVIIGEDTKKILNKEKYEVENEKITLNANEIKNEKNIKENLNSNANEEKNINNFKEVDSKTITAPLKEIYIEKSEKLTKKEEIENRKIKKQELVSDTKNETVLKTNEVDSNMIEGEFVNNEYVLKKNNFEINEKEFLIEKEQKLNDTEIEKNEKQNFESTEKNFNQSIFKNIRYGFKNFEDKNKTEINDVASFDKINNEIRLNQEVSLSSFDSKMPKKDYMNIFEQVKNGMQIDFNNLKKEMKIKLNPEELGEVEVKLSLENNIMKAQFTVQNEKVKEILESRFNDLKNNLSEKGIENPQINVNISNGGSQNEKKYYNEMNENLKNIRNNGLKIKNIENKIKDIEKKSIYTINKSGVNILY